ncbi:hypothetical protein LMG29542_05835 [Paraburkholderia humisilvae]|uniref:Uncharacterized protein n=1 Tax=Paraburkholderia humisilvae TaxID=627669 RepID=A0A6J5EP26_9BURK|nr:hypothetical protein LMG29542_05835 [Paraburkholderia humisilvae]
MRICTNTFPHKKKIGRANSNMLKILGQHTHTQSGVAPFVTR